MALNIDQNATGGPVSELGWFQRHNGRMPGLLLGAGKNATPVFSTAWNHCFLAGDTWHLGVDVHVSNSVTYL
jgi:hypothetical protein